MTFAQGRMKGTVTGLPQALTSQLRLRNPLAGLTGKPWDPASGLTQAGCGTLGPPPEGVGAGRCTVGGTLFPAPFFFCRQSPLPPAGPPFLGPIPTVGLVLLPMPQVPWAFSFSRTDKALSPPNLLRADLMVVPGGACRRQEGCITQSGL